MLSYERLSTKLKLFKSFTVLTLKEFDDIYDKEITKRYHKHEIKRLSKRKDREREIGAVGRHFKLDVKNRFLMLLVYYRLYITYTLSGFLFDLDQSNICTEIYKRLNIEYDKEVCTNSTEDIQDNQKGFKHQQKKSNNIFQAFLSFIDSTEQQQIQSRPVR